MDLNELVAEKIKWMKENGGLELDHALHDHLLAKGRKASAEAG